jgi:hypothetical protein
VLHVANIESINTKKKERTQILIVKNLSLTDLSR